MGIIILVPCSEGHQAGIAGQASSAQLAWRPRLEERSYPESIGILSGSQRLGNLFLALDVARGNQWEWLSIYYFTWSEFFTAGSAKGP